MTPREQVVVMMIPMWIMLLVLAYTILIHSRKRWPWASTWTRCIYILTFGTPPKPKDWK